MDGGGNMTQFMTQKGAVRLFQASQEACREGVAEMEARAGIEPAIKVLQTSALPLGYLAISEWLVCGLG